MLSHWQMLNLIFKKDLNKNLPKIVDVVAFNVYIGAKPNLRAGNLMTKKVNA